MGFPLTVHDMMADAPFCTSTSRVLMTADGSPEDYKGGMINRNRKLTSFIAIMMIKSEISGLYM